ncbi:hypothetical protein K1X76_09420 [bacterium]|nr:hypothetical protein [bacterium]
MGGINVNVNFKKIYEEVCPKSDGSDFEKTAESFLSEPAMQNFYEAAQVNTRLIAKAWETNPVLFVEGPNPVQGFSSEIAAELDGLFRIWLSEYNNCPPPSNSSNKTVYSAIEQASPSDVATPANEDLTVDPKPDEYENSAATLQVLGLLGVAVVASAASLILLADDAAGVGTADDGALAATVPAAATAAARAVEESVKLAAGVAVAVGLTPSSSASAQEEIPVENNHPDLSVCEEEFIDPITGYAVSLE